MDGRVDCGVGLERGGGSRRSDERDGVEMVRSFQMEVWGSLNLTDVDDYAVDEMLHLMAERDDTPDDSLG